MAHFSTPEEFFESLDQPDRLPNDEIVPPGERKCPICGERMSVETERGIRFDSCAAHGVWFDRGYLVAFRSRIHSEVQRARKEGQDTGLTFVGLYALLDALQ